ncbi:MAG: 2-amino-4-hydroxy-6-hydroxymethyldihydropteridine diphosphokinase [Actinobacteria bacterium]|nr:2-amino-4-hydroxy-6-hydroxymethyldihydropteridine diphosphokinase [Actinomycetota bacterium]MBM3712332.1 2-amino-4-hydroxy-6-hydroxymethyldihydropteridine diphosphokinase [Actinomycetota bacterium]
MFEIIIKNLKLFGYHGVNISEKKEGQEFLFNISIKLNKKSFIAGGEHNRFCDKHGSGQGNKYDDNISSTVNYSDIIELVKEANSSKSYDLLETLAEFIAQKIISYSPLISEVQVKVEKTSPPIKEKLESVGVIFNLKIENSSNNSNNEVTINTLEDFNCGRGPSDSKPSESEILPKSKTAADTAIYLTTYLSLGSNIGDREKNLREAVRQISHNKNIKIRSISSIYETEPMYIKEQEKFYNIAVEALVDKSCSPFELLGYFKKIEYDMGRAFAALKYGPRIIDIDILLYNDMKISSDILTIPHPKLAERKFVLIPLSEIAPKLEIGGRQIGQILNSSKTMDEAVIYKEW